MRIAVYSILIILYIISDLIDSVSLSYITGFLAFCTLCISIVYARGLYFYSGICFFVIGFSIYILNISQEHLAWFEFFLHFEPMLGILSLFFVLPFINSLIKVGKYDRGLNRFLQKGITNLYTLYRRSFIVCHILGMFLNIATIPLLSSSLKNTLSHLPKKRAEKFYTQNLLRAYALCLTWSPLEVMVITTLDLTNIHYLEFFIIIIPIVVLVILLDWILSRIRDSDVPLLIEDTNSVQMKNVHKKIISLAFLLITLVLIVSFIQKISNKGFLFSLVLVLIPFCFCWALSLGKSKRYIKITLPHWKERTTGLSNYFFMFLSAGFFVSMLTESGILTTVQEAFEKGAEHSLLLYFMIGGYFLLASLIGFHPLVSLTLLIALLQPILPVISSVSLALVLVTSSLASVMYSPFNLSVSILADHLQLNVYKIAQWNILFAVSYMLISIMIAYQLTLIL